MSDIPAFILRRRLEVTYGRIIQGIYEKLLSKVDVDKIKTEELPQVIRQLMNSPEFSQAANIAAQMMETVVRRDNEASWKMAARKGTMSRQIYLSLRHEFAQPNRSLAGEIVSRNAELIKTVPQDLARKFSHDIYKAHMQGLRGESQIGSLMAQAPYLTGVEARRIARTELSKANTAMTETRSRDLGLNWYTWKTANDGARVRPSHRHMQDVVCSWDDAPDPESLSGEKGQFGAYHPGCCPNCRCYAEPILDINMLPDSFRVHMHGSIDHISRRAFEEKMAS